MKHETRAPVEVSPWWADVRAVGIFLLLVTAAKFLVAGTTELLGDEAYYALWALYPLQPGYYDHPPAVAAFIKIGWALFGEHELGTRAPAILAGLFTCLAAWRVCFLATGSRALAALSAYWISVTPGAFIGLFVMTIDAPAILFWALTLWAVCEALKTNGQRAWWLAVGVFAGLGLTSKYVGLFLGAGLLAWVLLDARARHLFGEAFVYLGGVIALLIFAPVVWWNVNNGLSSFSFQAGRAFRSSWQPSDLVYIPEFLAGQAALLLPGLFVISLIALWRISTERNRKPPLLLSMLAVTALPLVVYFLVHGATTRVQGNWPWVIYPQLVVISIWAVQNLRIQWIPKILMHAAHKLHITMGAVVCFLICLQAVTQIMPLPKGLDRTADMHGWRQSVSDVATAVSEQGQTTLLVRGYQAHAHMAVYSAWADNPAVQIHPKGSAFRYGFIPNKASDTGMPFLVAPGRYNRDRDELIGTFSRLGPDGQRYEAFQLVRAKGD
ncbi:MAG: glycosyltransferase family 39 protein [Pseudomonadota bacterium]